MIKKHFNVLKKTTAAMITALMLGLAGCGDADKSETTEALVTTQGLAEQIEGSSDVADTAADTGSDENDGQGEQAGEDTGNDGQTGEDGGAETADDQTASGSDAADRKAANGEDAAAVQGTDASGEGTDVSIIMVGDLLMHDNISQSGYMGDGTINYDHIFAHVKDDVQAADVAVINNEVIYGGDDRGYQNYPMFNVLTQLGDSVVGAGFDVVLHASNHVLDQGTSGIENCLEFWNTKHPETAVLGIHESEEDAAEIYVYEKDGFKIAMLNYTYGMNGMELPSDKEYLVDLMTEETKNKVIYDIRRAKDMADAVVMFPHWGTEYNLGSDDFQHEWAQLFADEGVTLVLGDHPHVVEPVEWYTGKDGNNMLCYYSVGNFISSQTSSESMLGIMAKVTLHKGSDGAVAVKEYGIEPLVTHRRSGTGNFTTYKLSDYTPELVSQNSILNYDGRFSISFIADLTKQVFGDLYKGD